jgi:hypothetical protein
VHLISQKHYVKFKKYMGNIKIIIILILLLLTVGGIATFLYIKTNSTSPANDKHSLCVKYNNRLRNGACTTDAPSYCTTVYYPPSCEGCQDGSGCGYQQSN